jgi:hypothetical protein
MLYVCRGSRAEYCFAVFKISLPQSSICWLIITKHLPAAYRKEKLIREGKQVAFFAVLAEGLSQLQQKKAVVFHTNLVPCTVGYNEFDLFLEIKNTDPLMDAKFKSKTHLLNTFFEFFLIKKGIKSVGKALQKCTKESYKQNKFDEPEQKWKKCIFPSHFCC